MEDLKRNLKNYLLIKYTKDKLNRKNEQLSKSVPWIKRKQLFNTIQTHCSVLLNWLINNNCGFSFKESKFLVDSILKYSLSKGESLIKANGQTKSIKAFMQLNSFIICDEITKGLADNKSKKSIMFNIEKQLSEIQEQMDSNTSTEELLEARIGA